MAFVLGAGVVLPTCPLELYPRRHFQDLFKFLIWLYLVTQPPLQLYTLFSPILPLRVEGGKLTGCPTGAGPRPPPSLAGIQDGAWISPSIPQLTERESKQLGLWEKRRL